MRKKTALRTPENRKASPHQTEGLVAKGKKPRQSVQGKCVLDNRSHRTVCVAGARKLKEDVPKASTDNSKRWLDSSRQGPLRVNS